MKYSKLSLCAAALTLAACQQGVATPDVETLGANNAAGMTFFLTSLVQATARIWVALPAPTPIALR